MLALQLPRPSPRGAAVRLGRGYTVTQPRALHRRLGCRRSYGGVSRAAGQTGGPGEPAEVAARWTCWSPPRRTARTLGLLPAATLHRHAAFQRKMTTGTSIGVPESTNLAWHLDTRDAQSSRHDEGFGSAPAREPRRYLPRLLKHGGERLRHDRQNARARTPRGHAEAGMSGGAKGTASSKGRHTKRLETNDW